MKLVTIFVNFLKFMTQNKFLLNQSAYDNLNSNLSTIDANVENFNLKTTDIFSGISEAKLSEQKKAAKTKRKRDSNTFVNANNNKKPNNVN